MSETTNVATNAVTTIITIPLSSSSRLLCCSMFRCSLFPYPISPWSRVSARKDHDIRGIQSGHDHRRSEQRSDHVERDRHADPGVHGHGTSADPSPDMPQTVACAQRQEAP